MSRLKQGRVINPGYWVIATVVCQFFSYFGVLALLILYLTEHVKLSDINSYATYGAYTSLIYVTPIIGGWLADRWLGFKNSLILGCALMVLGYACLMLPGMFSLYLGLSIVVIGIGFFKSNVICLVSRTFEADPAAKATALTICYIGANIGAALGAIVCAFLAALYGWRAGFGCAAAAMAAGVLVLWCARSRLTVFDNQPTQHPLRALLWCFLAIVPCVAGVTWVIEFHEAGYVLTVIGLMALGWATAIFRKGTSAQRKGLSFILMLTLFGTLFWAFDQQGGSSINLFIARNINKHGIPTAMFQSVQPAVIIFFGLFTAWLWGYLNNKKIQLSVLLRVLPGFVLITAGFGLLFLGAAVASHVGQASMVWPIAGVACIGMAELFIDPVILTELTHHAPRGSVGVLTGMYYLFVGAFASYLAAKIAALTAVTSVGGQVVTLMQSAAIYRDNFLRIMMVGIGIIIVLVLMQQITHWYILLAFQDAGKVSRNMRQIAKYEN